MENDKFQSKKSKVMVQSHQKSVRKTKFVLSIVSVCQFAISIISV